MTSTLIRRATRGLRFLAAIAAGLMLASPAFGQEPEKPKAQQQRPGHAASGWQEMDAFHEVLAATWHPAARSNDLRPIRTKIDTLSQRAAAWASATVPKACDTPKVREAVSRVASDTRLLAMAIRRNAPDGEVKAALKGLHDSFEIAERGCKAPAHEGHH